MSYIHEALKKAQREKDHLAGKHGNVWSTDRNARRVFRREWMVSAGLVVIAVGFFSYSWLHSSNQQSSLHEQEQDAVVRRAAPKPSDRLHAGKAQESPSRPTPSKSQAAPGKRKEPDKALPGSKQGGKKKQEARLAVAKKPESDKAAILYDQGLALQKEGRLQEGKALYEAALESSPDLVSALNNLGAIYVKEKNYAAAGKMFEKAIRQKPGFVDPYYNLACLHALQNDVGRSLFYLKKAVSINRTVQEWARADKDLQNLHGHSEYEKIIQAVQES